jgi:hypothetical protein
MARTYREIAIEDMVRTVESEADIQRAALTEPDS